MIWMILMALTEPPVDPRSIPGYSECEIPAEDDHRPFTLCLAEYSFDQADAQLNRQWTVSLAHVEARKGARGVRKLRKEQRQWLKRRDRECDAVAADSPTTQSSRNQLSCMAELTEERTAQLKAMRGPN